MQQVEAHADGASAGVACAGEEEVAPPTPAQPLTWALVVSTYNRAHILPRCIRLAAQQTRPPMQIVVVDASADWQQTRDSIVVEMSAKHPQIECVYVQADRASLTAQRNQGIRLARADVLFLIDDDSLMYPNCADEVMKLYEADAQKRIAGIETMLVPLPPDAQDAEKKPQTPTGDSPASGGVAERGVIPRRSRLRGWAKRLLKTERYWVPYDEEFPYHSLPKQLIEMGGARIRQMHGARMTCRREVALREPFEEMLVRYAAAEDADASYRMSRHGLLLNCHHARICHLETSVNRMTRFTIRAMEVLNLGALLSIHGTDRVRCRRRYRRVLLHRTLIQVIKDLVELKLSLPHTRALLYAMWMSGKLFSMPVEALRQWYPRFQEELVSRDRNVRRAARGK